MCVGSALFLRAFPTKEAPKHLAIFGSGAQASSHATLLLELYPSLTSLTFIIRNETPRALSLLQTLKSTHPSLSINLSTSPSFNLSQTIHNANIIITLTPSTTSLFNSVDVTSGTRIVMVGSYKPSMREVDDELVKRAGLVVVDSREACGKEAGELISAGVTGEGMVELGEVLGEGEDVEGLRKKVEGSGDVVMFKSVSLDGIRRCLS
jgi:ornithine cyclodeaminase/alanine dehydrogenase-like protein (mu-crystallin family)